MLDQIPILSLITFSPLLGVLILLFMPAQNGKWLKTVAIAATFIPLILSAWLYADFNSHSDKLQYAEQFKWIEIQLSNLFSDQFSKYILEFDYHLAIDGLSLPLVFLTALVSSMAALASVHIKKRWKTFYILFLLLEVGMFGVFMARDLFLFFLFFEVTLVPVFFLVGIWGYKDREKAASKFLIYNGLGSAVMLIAFFILVSTAGFNITPVTGSEAYLSYTGDIQTIARNLFDPQSFANNSPALNEQMINPFYMTDTLKWSVFIMLLVAFGIKLPIFPFHTWMLKVHTEAPPSIVMIHSGILLKMGAYGLIRFGILLFPEQAKEWATVIAILGLINIIYGAVLAFVQKEFKLVLAYSSISHMGVVLLGLAAFNQTGMQGAIFQLVSHGLISALMFLVVGSLHERTGTTILGKLGGLAKSMPFMAGILLVSGMASLGLPSLSGFVGEFMAFLGVFDALPVVAIVGTLGIILAAVYVLRGVLRITFGPTPDKYSGLSDVRLVEAIPMITLVAFIVLLGVFPSIVTDSLQQTVIGFDQIISQVKGIGG